MTPRPSRSAGGTPHNPASPTGNQETATTSATRRAASADETTQKHRACCRWCAKKESMMSIEYGIFNAEGCIERDFYTEGQANTVKDALYQDEPGAYVAEMCREHDDQPREFCEDCAE